MGFAFNGDGDRFLCVYLNGNTVDGDPIIYLIAKYIKSKYKPNKNPAILSIIFNLKLLHKFEEENNLGIGGENSGHIILPEMFNIGNGIINVGFVVNLLFETNTTNNDWFKVIKMYVEKR